MAAIAGDFDSWRRTEFFSVLRVCLFFYSAGSTVILIIRWRQQAKDTFKIGHNVFQIIFNSSLAHALRYPSVIEIFKRCSPQVVDVVSVICMVFPILSPTLLPAFAKQSEDALIDLRVRVVVLQLAIPILTSHGFAPRLVLYLLAITMCWRLVDYGDDTDAVLFLILDCITILSGMFTFLVSEHCVQSQFKALYSADKMTSLRRSMELSKKSIFQSVFDASCVCDVNGNLLGSTCALDKVLGRPGQGKCLANFIDDPKRLHRFLQGALATRSFAVPLQVTSTGLPHDVEAAVFCVPLGDCSSDHSAEQQGLLLGISLSSTASRGHKECNHVISEQMSAIIGRTQNKREASKSGRHQSVVQWRLRQLLWRRVAFMIVVFVALVAVSIVHFQQGSSPHWPSAILSMICFVCGLTLAVSDLYSCAAVFRHGGAKACMFLDDRKRNFSTVVIQTLCIVSLGVAVSNVSLHIKGVLAKHKCFIILHILFSTILATFSNVVARSGYMCLAALKILAWLVFHWRLDFIKLTTGLTGCLLACITCYCSSVMKKKMSSVADALEDECVARDGFDAASVAYLKMQEAIFDATCHLHVHTHTLTCWSPQFADMFSDFSPDFSGLPFLSFGYSLEDKTIISQAIASAEEQRGQSAVVIQTRLTASSSQLPSKAKLAILIEYQDTGRTQEPTCAIFVGIQLVAADCFFDQYDWDEMRWVGSGGSVDEEDEIQTEDSVSSCRERLVVSPRKEKSPWAHSGEERLRENRRLSHAASNPG